MKLSEIFRLAASIIVTKREDYICHAIELLRKQGYINFSDEAVAKEHICQLIAPYGALESWLIHRKIYPLNYRPSDMRDYRVRLCHHIANELEEDGL